MAELDIEIKQGKTFRWFDTVTDANGLPIDLTGKTIRGMLRKSYSGGTVGVDIFSFNVIPDPDQVTNKGKVVYYLSAAETAGIAKGMVKVYDIEIEMDSDISVNNSDVYELWRGNVTLVLEATK